MSVTRVTVRMPMCSIRYGHRHYVPVLTVTGISSELFVQLSSCSTARGQSVAGLICHSFAACLLRCAGHGVRLYSLCWDGDLKEHDPDTPNFKAVPLTPVLRELAKKQAASMQMRYAPVRPVQWHCESASASCGLGFLLLLAPTHTFTGGQTCHWCPPPCSMHHTSIHPCSAASMLKSRIRSAVCGTDTIWENLGEED